MAASLNDRPNKITVSGDTTTVTTGSGIQGPQGATGATGAGGTIAYYGNFFSTETQNNAGATSKNTFTLNSTVSASGVSISSGTRILFASGAAGTYDLQFSAQFDKTDSGTDEVDVWISKNGTDLEWSNTTLSLVGNNAKVVAAWNWQLNNVAAGDYFELHWSSADTALRVLAQAAGTSPTRPAIPSLIVTVAQITYTQAGAAGSAATVAVGSTTTGAAGSSASVTNSGTSSAAVFNFTIPRGDTGATGATGPEGGTSTLTTKGDLLGRDSSSVARVAVGADGYVLTADSTQTTGVKWAAASGGISPTIVDAKGDLIVASAADTVTRLAVGATNGHVLTVDSGQTLGIKWASQTEWAVSRSTFWQVPPYIALPVGTSWPLLNRAYFVPVSLKPGTVITALAINVTSAGASGNVVRLGIFSDNGGTPGTILDQSTVVGDSLGVKTWTLSSAFTPSGLFWLAACPQGSGAAGGAWLGSVPVYSMPTTDSSASWGGQSNVAVGFATASSTFTSNPTMTWEQQNRFPYIGMRVQ